MTRRPAVSIVASPVLVGAVTVLVVIVSVFLAYNANTGLPFVPTYEVSAEIPGGANLVEGNEVRVGGFRVGLVREIRPRTVEGGPQRSIAVIDMSLDKAIEPLTRDTRVLVRTRSALGLKYVELTPGTSEATFEPGATIPLANSLKPIELDEFFSTFDDEMRANQRTALKGYGDAFTGRGSSINVAIEELVPFMTHLEPVMRALSDPDTELDEFFKQAGRTSAQVAPVATTYASLFVNMATTFEALSRHPESLRGAIERAAPTLRTGISSFRVQRPFLADAERLFTHLEPVATELHRSLPPVSDALDVGEPVQRKAPPFYARTQEVLESLDELAENPSTLLALKDLTTTVKVLEPLVAYVAPYQTVCNYWNYFWTPLGEHISEPVRGGTIQRVLSKSDNRTQDNRLSTSDGDRPADVRSSLDPQTAENPAGDPLVALHGGAYAPAVDAQGHADCSTGQRGYLDGPLVTDGRYPPSDDPAVGSSMDDQGGGSHVVLDTDFPGLAGPTYKAKELGIDSVDDVP